LFCFSKTQNILLYPISINNTIAIASIAPIDIPIIAGVDKPLDFDDGPGGVGLGGFGGVGGHGDGPLQLQLAFP